MKLKNYEMICLIFGAFIFITGQLRAQVKTDYNNRVAISARGKFNQNFTARIHHVLPAKSIKALLDKEAADSNSPEAKPFRIAEPVSVDIDVVENSTWIADSAFAYGKFTVNATDAKTISANFDKFYLPPGTELYVYTNNGEMITGPVTETENNKDRIWGTWVYKGGLMTIDVKCPLKNKSSLQLHLSNIAYGYKDIYRSETANFGESSICNINVLCALGNGWDTERSSVALILGATGSALCSGALINNACNLNIPYLLTANHCFQASTNVANWRFTFLAWSPTCAPSQNASGITFNGSTLRSNSFGSDFCLLQLNQTPTGNTGITYSGWSRNVAGITQTTIIHHPAGDVMKISRDNDAPVFSVFNAAQTWQLVLDQGATNGGSSGAPYYDQNHRIIGQHFGINQNNTDQCLNVNKFGGRFDVSWAGEGTNVTRLSNWLDPGNSGVMTTNSRGIPFVTYAGGPICTTANFIMQNLPAGSTVNWTGTGLSFTGGTATRVGNYSGLVTVTGTVTTPCGNYPLTTVNVPVGSPAPTYININNTSCPEYYFDTNYVPTATTYTWQYNQLPSGPITTQIRNVPSTLRIVFNSGYSYRIGVSANNACGSSAFITTTFTVSCSGGGGHLLAFPNPANNSLTVAYKADSDAGKEVTQLLPKIESAILKGTDDRMYVQSNEKATSVDLPVANLPSGIYYLHVQIDGKTEILRILINH